MSKFTVYHVCRNLLHDVIEPDWIVNIAILDPHGNPTFMKVSRIIACPATNKVHIQVDGIDEEDECQKAQKKPS